MEVITVAFAVALKIIFGCALDPELQDHPASMEFIKLEAPDMHVTQNVEFLVIVEDASPEVQDCFLGAMAALDDP